MKYWLRKLLYRFTSGLPLEIYSEQDRPYLERYYLGTLFGKRFYIHRFVGSDPDRGLHDHPWRWAVSIILAGWYFEETRIEGELRIVDCFNRLTGDTFHSVILPPGQRDVWTLFFHPAEKVKPWGFLLPGTPQFDPVWSRVRTVQTYTSASGLNPSDWWLTAPLGRDHPGRMEA